MPSATEKINLYEAPILTGNLNSNLLSESVGDI